VIHSIKKIRKMPGYNLLKVGQQQIRCDIVSEKHTCSQRSRDPRSALLPDPTEFEIQIINTDLEDIHADSLKVVELTINRGLKEINEVYKCYIMKLHQSVQHINGRPDVLLSELTLRVRMSGKRKRITSLTDCLYSDSELISTTNSNAIFSQ